MTRHGRLDACLMRERSALERERMAGLQGRNAPTHGWRLVLRVGDVEAIQVRPTRGPLDAVDACLAAWDPAYQGTAALIGLGNDEHGGWQEYSARCAADGARAVVRVWVTKVPLQEVQP